MKLTKATEIFLKHYNLWTKNTNSKQIKDYNNHKIRHSIWVLEYGRLILLKLWDKISDEFRQDAELCFILHDIARFYQNDWKKVLANNMFEHWNAWYNLALKDWYSIEICLAIKYHNKKDLSDFYLDKQYQNLPKEKQKKAEFLAKITRDADKLENMIYLSFDPKHILLLDKENQWDLKKENISKEAFKNILEEKIIERENIVTKIDKILAMISWIFDINFFETKQILNQNNFIEKIFDFLEKNIIEADKKNLEKIKEICKKNLINK